MDKIPKFRRRPKPPAIETQVERSSSDTVESVSSSAAAPAQVPPSESVTAVPSKPPLSRNASSGASSVKTMDSLRPPSRKSAFRGLRLRASNKRMRDMSPASSISRPSTPPVATTGQDGVKMQKREESSTQPSPSEYDTAMEDLPEPDSGPEMPSFLNLSRQAIDNKLNELNWDERIRAVAGQRTDNGAQPKYSTFRQTDGEERGFMDRYVNIRPWNHNRVRLQVPPGQFDYVNASAITLTSPSDPSRPPLRYIAMQGPTEPSFPYVWRMIAEQIESPTVIIQLTSMSEAGVVKCSQYFPNSLDDPTWVLNEQDIWGDGWKATLTYESLDSLADGAIEKRKLLLHVDGEEEPRTVWHFLYCRWPDFGVPHLDDMENFFDLMRISREHSTPKGPRVVHCSAGIGRTGTFITLEHLIRELDVGALFDPPATAATSDNEKKLKSQPAKPDLIYDTVDSLRQQRRGMVQGEPQYRFVYQVMRKLWQERYNPGVDEDEDMVDGGVAIAKSSKPTAAPDPFVESTKDNTNGNGVTDTDDKKNSNSEASTDIDDDDSDENGDDDEEDGAGGAAVPGPSSSATRG